MRKILDTIAGADLANILAGGRSGLPHMHFIYERVKPVDHARSAGDFGKGMDEQAVFLSARPRKEMLPVYILGCCHYFMHGFAQTSNIERFCNGCAESILPEAGHYGVI